MITLRGRDPDTGQLLQVKCAGDRITSVDGLPEETCDDWLSAGFIDLQVNGYGGIDLNRDDLAVQDVIALTDKLALLGTTRYLPTIITGSRQKIAHCIEIIRQAREENAQVHHAVAGIHLEGPYLSPEDGYRGAHDASQIRRPSLDEFAEWQRACGGLIRLITLSPHWPGVAAFIRAVCAMGVRVAIGHTSATGEQIKTAVDAGATLSTHLGNGLPSQLARHPNPIWSQLAEDSLSASFIADGVHVDAATLTSMIRCKGKSRSILISDSVALAGGSPGRYRASVGGDVSVEEDGSIRMSSSSLLAGSGIALRDAVARAPGLAGVTLGDAVEMASRHPAALLDLKTGLVAGAPADLVLFRWKPHETTLQIRNVMVQGTWLRQPDTGNEEG
ncbi:MAG: amidohydrolase family protein [Edaphobacter sp.]|uniref:N-acetylglucosamine-6-phosphate deacetylase n=1 Tax=Edaphobacter sp. TaxID=1934404 RepID=UPI0023899E4C|nr:amidohydrolase family protein [Edaphobacter sp.]MDE1177921.1 amidohydrolase family protein [Edaphobacter sp.]